MMKDAFAGLGAIFVVVGIVVGGSIGGYYLYAHLAPKYEATRRDVMIESRAYSEGTVRELHNLRRQYEAAKTDTERAMIAAAAKHEFSIFPADRLPPELRLFLIQVGG